MYCTLKAKRVYLFSFPFILLALKMTISQIKHENKIKILSFYELFEEVNECISCQNFALPKRWLINND